LPSLAQLWPTLVHDKDRPYKSAPGYLVKRDPWEAEEEGHLNNVVITSKTIVKWVCPLVKLRKSVI